MSKLSVTSGSAGEEQFYAVCTTPSRAIFGTWTSPARLVAYHVGNNSRIEGVTLAAGISSAADCLISHDSATLIASMGTSPAKFVQHNVADLSQAASPLTLNAAEDKGRYGCRDRTSTFAYFAFFVSTAKCAKIQWSDNTRAAVIDMSAGENFGFGLDIDTATNELIMSTWTSPAYAIKISTSPTFARTSSLALNSGENSGASVTIADGFYFIACWVAPGIVVKIKSSDLSRVGAVTLSANQPRSSVADWKFLYVVTWPEPASVVRVRLSDLTEMSVLQLQVGKGIGGALPGGNRSAGVAFFSMQKAGQLGLSVKVQLDASGAVVPNMVRLSVTNGSAGEEQFYAVCTTPSRAIFGTLTSPARLIAYHVSNNSRIEGVTLAAGINSAVDCVSSHDGATLIVSVYANPAKFVKHNVVGLAQAATPLTLNAGEVNSTFGTRDPTFAFFSLKSTPSKCAKIQWSDNSRVAVIGMNTGENLGNGLDIDTATADLVMSTDTSPAYAVKISTSPTFARTSSLQLDAGENRGYDVTVVDGFSFISCYVSPGIVVKVQNSDLTRVGAVTLAANQAYGSVADWQFLYVVSETDPANVVQVRLSDLSEVSVLQLQEGRGIAGALPGGNRSAGVAFFSMYKSGQLGLSVKVQLDARGKLSLLLLSVSTTAAAGDEKFSAACASSTHVVYGTATNPARLIAYHVSNNSRIEGVELAAGFDNAMSCVVSHDGATLLASMNVAPAKFVKHFLGTNLSEASSPLTLNAHEGGGMFGSRDSTSTFAYFALYATPARCAKLRWSDNTRAAVIGMASGEEFGHGLDFDASSNELVLSTWQLPAVVVKLSTDGTAGFSRTSSLQLNGGENFGYSLTTADGFSFVSCAVSPGIVVKVRIFDMTRIAALTLPASANQPRGSVADWKFLYVVSNTDPASVVQVHLSNFTEVSTLLQLQEGKGVGAALPSAGNRSAGVAFFAMSKPGQRGLSVKVSLDATGALVPRMRRLSVGATEPGEEMLHAVCASASEERVVYGTYTAPARLVAYSARDNSRVASVTPAAGISEAVGCVVSHDGATLIMSTDQFPAKFVKHNVADLSQGASPLTLNTGENQAKFGTRDKSSTFAFFPIYTSPAKCAKIQWSDNTRVAVIDMASGENSGYGIDFDTETSGDLVMTAFSSSPSFVIKISNATSPTTFARAAALQLNSGEDLGYYLTAADGFSFVSCRVDPGIIVKVRNADMTRVAAVTLRFKRPRGSVADYKFLYVVTYTNPARIVQLRLADLATAFELELTEGSGIAGALASGGGGGGDDRSAGVAFFSMLQAGQRGVSVQVQLDPSGRAPPKMVRMSVAAADAGEEKFNAVCASASHVIYGTLTAPARLVAYDAGSNTRIGGVVLGAAINNAIDCLISADGATVIASMADNPAKFVKHNVAGGGLGQAASPLTLNAGESSARFGVRDPSSAFAFFPLYTTPAKVAKLRWGDLSRAAVVDMSAGENYGHSLGHAATNELMMTTDTTAAFLVKINASATSFERAASVQLSSGENEAMHITVADGFSFVSCWTSPGIVVKVRNADMTRVGSVNLTTVNKPRGSVADYKFLYVVSNTEPATVVQVRLSDLSEMSSLQLQEGSGIDAALPGGDRSAGVAFFSMYKSGQLGLSVKLQLDPSGSVAPSLQRLSVAAANFGEAGFYAVCASASRVVYGTFTAPVRLVGYDVGSNTRIEGVTLAGLSSGAIGCVVSRDGARLTVSMNTNPATFAQHNVVGLSQSADPLSLNPGENQGRFGATDTTFAYFAIASAPAKCAKLRWSDNTRVAVSTMSSGEDFGYGIAIDIDAATATSSANDFSIIILSTFTSPAHVTKIATSPTFTRSSALQLDAGENSARFVTVADGFSFISCYVSPGIVVKVRNSDMTRVAAVTLAVNQAYGNVADLRFLYVISDTYPATVVQLRLSDLSEVSSLALQEGGGVAAALPGGGSGDRSAGVAFFSIYRPPLLGFSLKVQLDASGSNAAQAPASTTTTTIPTTTTTSTTAPLFTSVTYESLPTSVPDLVITTAAPTSTQVGAPTTPPVQGVLDNVTSADSLDEIGAVISAAAQNLSSSTASTAAPPVSGGNGSAPAPPPPPTEPLSATLFVPYQGLGAFARAQCADAVESPGGRIAVAIGPEGKSATLTSATSSPEDAAALRRAVSACVVFNPSQETLSRGLESRKLLGVTLSAAGGAATASTALVLNSVAFNGGPVVVRTGSSNCTTTVTRGARFSVDLGFVFHHHQLLPLTLSSVTADGFPIPQTLRVSMNTSGYVNVRGTISDTVPVNLSFIVSDGFKVAHAECSVVPVYFQLQVNAAKNYTYTTPHNVHAGVRFVIAVPFDMFKSSSQYEITSVLRPGRLPLPSGVSFEPPNTILGTLRLVGLLNWTVTAADPFNEVTSYILINSTNRRPTCNATAATIAPVFAMREFKREVRLSSFCTDGDNDALTYSYSIASIPSWLRLEIQPGGASQLPQSLFMRGTPPKEADAANVPIAISVTDGIAHDRLDLTLAVTPNTAPTLVRPLQNYTIYFGEAREITVELAKHFVDHNGDVLAYTITVPEPAKKYVGNVRDDGSGIIVLSVSAPDLKPFASALPEADYAVKFEVTDPLGNSTSADLMLSVRLTKWQRLQTWIVLGSSLIGLVITIIGWLFLYVFVVNFFKSRCVTCPCPLSAQRRSVLLSDCGGGGIVATCQLRYRVTEGFFCMPLVNCVKFFSLYIWDELTLVDFAILGNPPDWLAPIEHGLELRPVFVSIGGRRIIDPNPKCEEVVVRMFDHSGIILSRFTVNYKRCFSGWKARSGDSGGAAAAAARGGRFGRPAGGDGDGAAAAAAAAAASVEGDLTVTTTTTTPAAATPTAAAATTTAATAVPDPSSAPAAAGALANPLLLESHFNDMKQHVDERERKMQADKQKLEAKIDVEMSSMHRRNQVLESRVVSLTELCQELLGDRRADELSLSSRMSPAAASGAGSAAATAAPAAAAAASMGVEIGIPMNLDDDHGDVDDIDLTEFLNADENDELDKLLQQQPSSYNNKL